VRSGLAPAVAHDVEGKQARRANLIEHLGVAVRADDRHGDLGAQRRMVVDRNGRQDHGRDDFAVVASLPHDAEHVHILRHERLGGS
jgi:hypothetical protein